MWPVTFPATSAPRQPAALLACCALLLLLPARTAALHAYGHAYSRPHDFTAAQYAAIAADFGVFTVEKAHAADVYGNASQPPPFRTNSYAATVGTARNIKAINASVRVLMYWNSMIHFNFYECEAAVQPDWVEPHAGKPPYYRYEVAAFRDWWVQCAAQSVLNSSGVLDGLFLDATPKVPSQYLPYWRSMVDELRAALGPHAVILNNGFYTGGGGQEMAGVDEWAHSNASYVESLSSIGNNASHTPQQSRDTLVWLSNASAAFPSRTLVGHGKCASVDVFVFGLAKYMLFIADAGAGWFLANSGSYSIDGGLLSQPDMDLYYRHGAYCGEPLTPYFEETPGAPFSVFRKFQGGTVSVDLVTETATIDCANTTERQ